MQEGDGMSEQPDDPKEQTRRLWREIIIAELTDGAGWEFAVNSADRITREYKHRIESGEL